LQVQSPLHVPSIILPAYEFLASTLFPDQVRIMRDAAQDSRPHLLIFTSPRAVQYGLDQIPAELFRTARIGAMGPSTAQLLEAAGLLVSLRSEKAYSTEGLLGVLQLEGGVSSAEPRHAFILAAPGGRSRLKEGLVTLGYVAHMLMVYERRSAELPAEAIAAIEQADSGARLVPPVPG
jgi:uroporphyrinogen-III synthase